MQNPKTRQSAARSTLKARRRRPVQRNKNKIAERRRRSSERRRNEAIAQFPIITTQGICVRRDRRKIPDRRMASIVVKETTMNEEVFETLFSNYLQYKERMKLIKKLRNEVN